MNAASSAGGRWASPRTEVDRVAILLIDAWETAEGTRVNPSRVATFVDMARAVIADRATAPDTAHEPGEHGEPAEDATPEGTGVCGAVMPDYEDERRDGPMLCTFPKGHGPVQCDPEDDPDVFDDHGNAERGAFWSRSQPGPEQCPWCGGEDRSVRPRRTDMGVPCNNLAWHTTAPTPTPDNLNPAPATR